MRSTSPLFPSDANRNHSAGSSIELVIRDFVQPWYMVNDKGGGISNNSEFIEYSRVQLSNITGNLLCRMRAINPLSILFDDVSEAFRLHLGWYGEMQLRAQAASEPGLFDELTDEQLLGRALARHGVMRSSGALSRPSYALSSTSSASVTGAVMMATSTAEPASAPASTGSSSLSASSAAPINNRQQDGASLTEQSLILAERRRIDECRERAIMSQYSLVARSGKSVLHPACDIDHTPLLEAQPSDSSFASIPLPTGPTTPPALAAEHAYLRPICSQLIQKLLPSSERSASLQGLLLREVVTTCILQPLLSNLEPDYCNTLLVDAIRSANSTQTPGTQTSSTAPIVNASASTSADAHQPTNGGGSEVRGLGASTSVSAQPLMGTAASGLDKALVTSRMVAGYKQPIYQFLHDFDDTQAPSRSHLIQQLIHGYHPSTPAIGPGPRSITDSGLRYSVGTASKNEAEAVLSGAPVGTFLLRSIDGGTTVLSFVGTPPDQAVKSIAASDHALAVTEISHLPLRTEQSKYFAADGAGPFDSISAFLRSLKHLVWIGCVLQQRDDGHNPFAVAGQPVLKVALEDLYGSPGAPARGSADTSVQSTAAQQHEHSGLMSAVAPILSKALQMQAEAASGRGSTAMHHAHVSTTGSAGGVASDHRVADHADGGDGGNLDDDDDNGEQEEEDEDEVDAEDVPATAREASRPGDDSDSGTDDDGKGSHADLDTLDDWANAQGQASKATAEHAVDENSDPPVQPTLAGLALQVAALERRTSTPPPTAAAAALPPSTAARPRFSGLHPQAYPSLASIIEARKTAGKTGSTNVVAAALPKFFKTPRLPGTGPQAATAVAYRDSSAIGAGYDRHPGATSAPSSAASTPRGTLPDGPEPPPFFLISREPSTDSGLSLSVSSGAASQPLEGDAEDPIVARITRATVRMDEQITFDSKAVVLYVINVQQGSARWSIRARYSEMHELHTLIKAAVPEVKLKFPPKQSFMIAGHYDSDFIETRRAALDAWLQAVIRTSAVLNSMEVRTFLSPHPGSVSYDAAPARSMLKPHRSAGASMSDLQQASLGDGIRSTLKQNNPDSAGAGSEHLSTARRHVKFGSLSDASTSAHNGASLSAVTPMASLDGGGAGDGLRHRRGSRSERTPTEPGRSLAAASSTASTAQLSRDRVSAPAGIARVLTPTELQRAESRFFRLISDIFDLESSGWLRRQMVGATRTMLKLMYHGAAARKVADAYQSAISPSSIAAQIHHVVHNVVWPGGKLRDPYPVRTWQQRIESREECRDVLLAAVLSPPLTSLLGTSTTEAGIVKLHAFIQIPILVRSLTYTIFDLLIARIFPGIKVHALPPRPPPPAPHLKSKSTGAVPAMVNVGGQIIGKMADASIAVLRTASTPAVQAVQGLLAVPRLTHVATVTPPQSSPLASVGSTTAGKGAAGNAPQVGRSSKQFSTQQLKPSPPAAQVAPLSSSSSSSSASSSLNPFDQPPPVPAGSARLPLSTAANSAAATESITAALDASASRIARAASASNEVGSTPR